MPKCPCMDHKAFYTERKAARKERWKRWLQWRKERPHPSTVDDFKMAYVLWKERRPFRRHNGASR